MKKYVALDFQTQSGPLTAVYNLANNPIAQQWAEKIKQLQHQGIGIDSDFTSDTYGKIKFCVYYTECLNTAVDWVNSTTEHHILKKDYYTQEDLCIMHDVYVELANNPQYDIFSETYQLNKYIHFVEHTLKNSYPLHYFTIAWGVNDGVTMQDFDQDPYQYYTSNLCPGNIYLSWVEIGKKPHEYLNDNDPEDVDSFLNTVRPHRTWSAHCKINLTGSYRPSKNFWTWFEKYRKPFLEKWNLAEWTDLHEVGAIELAVLQDPLIHKQLLTEFDSLNAIRILTQEEISTE